MSPIGPILPCQRALKPPKKKDGNPQTYKQTHINMSIFERAGVTVPPPPTPTQCSRSEVTWFLFNFCGFGHFWEPSRVPIGLILYGFVVPLGTTKTMKYGPDWPTGRFSKIVKTTKFRGLTVRPLWDPRETPNHRFLEWKCSILAVSGPILMIFSIFSTTIVILSWLQHFLGTIYAWKHHSLCQNTILG